MGSVRQTAEDAGLRGFFCLLPGLVEPSNLAPHPLLSFSRRIGRKLYRETVLDKCTGKGVGGIYFWDSDKNTCSHYHVAFGGAMTNTVAYVTYLVYILVFEGLVLGGTGYAVFVLGHSGWWWVLAVFVGASAYTPEKWIHGERRRRAIG
jgi:hypothetical protein